jgi:hypothetical protein
MTEPLKVIRNARGKRPQFYATPGLDQAMSMIMVLANELMVVRDRLDTVEQVAAGKGLVLDAEIEAYEPDQAVLERREARRQDFLDRLYYLARKEAAELATNDTGERYRQALDAIAVGDEPKD